MCLYYGKAYSNLCKRFCHWNLGFAVHLRGTKTRGESVENSRLKSFGSRGVTKGGHTAHVLGAN